MLQITSTLDWENVRAELAKLATSVGQYQSVAKILNNVHQTIVLLGREEIDNRRKGKATSLKAQELIDEINEVIQTIEQHLMLEVLIKGK